MKIIQKEFIRNLLTHWRYNLLIFFELAIVVLIGYIAIYNLNMLNFKSVSYSSTFSNNNYFALYMNDEDSNLIYKNDAIQNSAVEIKKQIFNSPIWDAYDIFEDMFVIEFDENGEKQLPENLEIGYEEGETQDPSYNFQALKAYAVSRDACDIYNFKVSEGRLFSDDDYILEEEHGYSTAVLLGSAYRDYYDVGDIINGYGFEPERNITIVGFLEEGTLFGAQEKDRLFPLDRYILFPIHNQKINLDGKVTGNPWVEEYNLDGFTKIVSKGDLQTVQNELNRITNAAGFPAIICQQWGGSQIESTAIVSRRNVILFTGLTILLCGVAIISMAHVLSRKTEKNMRTYAVYMLSGISPRAILLSMALEALMLSLLAVIPTIWASYMQFGAFYTPFRYLFYISVPVIIISLLPACRLIMKINLDQLSRRKSE